MKEWAVWMANKMEEQLLRMEQLRLSEFVAYEKNWKKRLLMQFVGGIARGLGTAVGFTLLGALVVWLLQGLVQRNLPIIGDFLTQLLNLVEGKGSGSYSAGDEAPLPVTSRFRRSAPSCSIRHFHIVASMGAT